MNKFSSSVNDRVGNSAEKQKLGHFCQLNFAITEKLFVHFISVWPGNKSQFERRIEITDKYNYK